MGTPVQNHRFFPIVNLFNPGRKLKKRSFKFFELESNTVLSSTKLNMSTETSRHERKFVVRKESFQMTQGRI